MKAWRQWQDWTNAVLGVWMFLAPWLLGTTTNTASSWNAWILGSAIVVVSLWALGQPESAGAEYTNAILGTWVLIAPWVLGFSAVTAAASNAWIVGLVVLCLALWAAQQTKHPTPQGR